MFKRKSAHVYYGANQYDLSAFNKYETVESADQIDADVVAEEAARCSGGWLRVFKIIHSPELIFTKEEHDVDLIIPETISAMANGFHITWHKVK